MRHPTDLDELVLGELPPERRADVTAHLKVCAECAREYDALVEEHRLFAQRRVAFAAPVPPFELVASEVRRRQRSVAVFRGFGALVAAAALAMMVGRTPAQDVPPADVGGVCGASWLAVSWCEMDERIVDDAARAEDEFRACLIGTPG